MFMRMTCTIIKSIFDLGKSTFYKNCENSIIMVKDESKLGVYFHSK